jgi:LacI family transcriptional regulator
VNPSMTIADIAKRAGCSKSTVARALNDRPDVSPETRARILAIMDEVAFVPDERARALASGRSATLGLMVANLTSPYSHALIRSFENEARQAGYSVLLLDTSHDASEEGKAVTILRRKRVDGVAVMPVGESSEHVRRLASLGVPTVLIARYFTDCALDVVRHDNRRTGYLVTRHLLELGHRRILYLNRDAAISTVADRLEGIREALADAELPPTTVTVWRTDATAEGGYTAIWAGVGSRASGARQLILGSESDRLRRQGLDATSTPLRPATGQPSELHQGGDSWARTLPPVPDDFPFSAVIAYNDYCALGAQRALQEAGYRVPTDVSLVACSDSGICNFLPVRLTAIQDDWTALGRSAFLTLQRRITDPRGPIHSIVLPTELVVRESTITYFA